MDIFTPEKRSEVMSLVRSTGTGPEARMYIILRNALGHRWRIDRNVRGLPGCPDLVVPSLKLAVFADGCFFHLCPRHGGIPKSNTDYWQAKLLANVRRDSRQTRLLRASGMSVWRLWEHDLKANSAAATAWRLERRLQRRIGHVRAANSIRS